MKIWLLVVSLTAAAILLYAPADRVFAVTVVLSGILLVLLAWMFRDAKAPVLPEPDPCMKLDCERDIQILTADFEYLAARVRALAGWRDGFTLALFGGYAGLILTAIWYWEKFGGLSAANRGIVAFALTIIWVAGWLVLLRLGYARGHGARAQNQLVAISRQFRASIPETLKKLVGVERPAVLLGWGAHTVCESLVVALNSLPLMGLLFVSSLVPFAEGDTLPGYRILLATWVAITTLQLVVYNLFVGSLSDTLRE